MIRFNRVRYKNFLSTGDKFTEIDLNATKTTLIVGQNGSGKSTMLDAISFALFGKPHRNINKPQLVNSVNKKGCVVEVEFEINKNQFKVVRSIKRSRFEIWKNGTLLNQNSHSKEYQKILEQNILKLNHKTFHQVVVLGSSSFIPFMQLSANNRREVIEDLLDINVFSKMNQLQREKNAALKDRVNDNLHKIDLISTKEEGQRKYIREISRINDDVKQEKEDLIQRYRTEKDTHVAAVTALNDKIAANNAGLDEELNAARLEVTGLRDAETEITTKIKALVKETKFYENNQSCPTCEQDIDEDLKQSKVGQARVKATEFQSRIAEIASRKSEATDKLTRAEERLRQNTEWQSEIQTKQNLIRNCDAEISIAQEDINNLTNDKSDLTKAKQDHDALLEESRKLQETKLQLNEQQQYNTVVLELLKDTGFKTKIIKQYLPVINKLVNTYLQVLDFFVHFNLDENFDESIRSRYRDSFSYDSFSEGEKQRIDLALLFTWRQIAKMKNSVSTNLLVLDETFDSSLDHDGIENLMKILHTLGDDTNIFVISHKGDLLEGKFDSKIEFVKHKNFSKMKV